MHILGEHTTKLVFGGVPYCSKKNIILENIPFEITQELLKKLLEREKPETL